jgi:hypothetical protein
VGVFVYPPIVARQRLGKYVSAATNNLSETLISMRSVSYRSKVGDWFLPELVVWAVINKFPVKFHSPRMLGGIGYNHIRPALSDQYKSRLHPR